MGTPLLNGIVCRILICTSLAYSLLNQVTFEFSTNQHASTHGIGVCLNRKYDLDVVKIISIQQAASQFDQNSIELVSSLGDVGSSIFFSGASKWLLDPVVITNVTHILQSDPYYAAAISQQRYDELGVDPSWWNTFPWNRLVPSQNAWAPFSKTRSCFIISGNWKPQMKYQVTVSINNPKTAEGDSDSATQFWMVPLTYAQPENGNNSSMPKFSVRGSKRGNTCAWRAGLQPRYFDACKEATAAGLLGAGGASLQDCIQALKNRLATLGSKLSYPYDQLLLSVSNTSSQGACGTGKVVSASAFSECVDCLGGAIQGSSCHCNANRVPLLVGTQACGPLLTAAGSASSPAAVADKLCQETADLHTALLKGQISDAVVGRNLLRVFAAKAAYILDWADIMESNTSFWREQTVDARWPGAAARNTGLAPNCNRCEKGLFLDIFSGRQVPVYDDRYQAVQTLRLIGYILQRKGYACNRMYTQPTMTLKQLYGTEVYDDTICNPLPKVHV